ncbi:MAG: hypothetical protein A2X23_12375 [Chloroflexi bacterium GWC2_73_18]|nr:MAG: hypothetical protein A2X23_12375 [Chloroflexi bacterium GWC2_73_18]
MRPEEMSAAIVRNLAAKTGRALDEWIDLAGREGPATRRQRVEWLKAVHGLGHGQAEQIAWRIDRPPGEVPPTDEQLIEAQYTGPKASLRPIYERLAEAIRALGPDAAAEARQTYVSLVRRRQFGLIAASTRTRIDLGLRLPGVAPVGRLQPAGSFGSGQVTHRVGLGSPGEVDAEVVGWLRAAYEARG